MALQLASWRSAYKGLLSDAYLAGPVETDILATFAREQGLKDFRLLAEGTGAPLGFVAVIEKAGAPYVDNLHVSPEAKGQGIGAALMRAAAARLSDRGDDRMWLTVIAENRGAIGFYRRIGGEIGKPVPDVLFGQEIRSREVHWHGLDPLL